MASTHSVTTLLLWERVVVIMRLLPGASFSVNPKAPNPGIPHMVRPSSAPDPSWQGERSILTKVTDAQTQDHLLWSVPGSCRKAGWWHLR